MKKQKLVPIPRIEFDKIIIGDSIEIHADRLAAFKSSVSRYNKHAVTKLSFDYGPFKNDYCTAVSVIYKPKNKTNHVPTT